VLPLPAVAPDTPLCVTVQANVVPATLLVRAIDVAVPEQIVCVAGVAVATGVGLTVIVTVIAFPAHPFAVGVTL
jgi:hypothetical protein